MTTGLSARLLAIVEALPLRPGMRVLEIGCGPGAMAREIVRRIGDGQVLAIDRSQKAIAQAEALSAEELRSGRLLLRRVAAEEFALAPGEAPYDVAVAVRVGAFDIRTRDGVACRVCGLRWWRAGASSSTAATRFAKSRCRHELRCRLSLAANLLAMVCDLHYMARNIRSHSACSPAPAGRHPG